MGKLDDIIQIEILHDERFIPLTINDYIDFCEFLELLTAFVESNKRDTARFLFKDDFLQLTFYTDKYIDSPTYQTKFIRHKFDEYKDNEIVDIDIEHNYPIENFLQRYTQNKYENGFFEQYYFKVSDLLSNQTMNKFDLSLSNINKYMKAMNSFTLHNMIILLDENIRLRKQYSQTDKDLQPQSNQNKLQINQFKAENQQLKTEIGTLQKELAETKQNDHSPTIENIRNQDPKIIAMMAILLADSNTKYKWGEKPNKSAIESAIKSIIDTKFYIDSKHTHGLDSPSKRISDCLKVFEEFFYTLPNPKK